MILKYQNNAVQRQWVRRPITCGTALLLGSLALTISALTSSLFGASGNIIQLPALTTKLGSPAATTYSRQSGLHLKVDTTWAADQGYRPVRVTFQSAGPSTADRLITVRFSAGDWNSHGNAINVEQDFMLAQGSSRATMTIAVPQFSFWQLCGWEVWVDGVKDEQLSAKRQNIGVNRRNGLGNTTLVVGQDVQQAEAVEKLLQQWAGDPTNIATLLVDELPMRWIDLSGVDVIAISRATAMELASTDSARMDALLRWNRVGGNLLIHDVGEHFDTLSKLENAMGLSPAADGDRIPGNETRLLTSNWQIYRFKRSPTEEIDSEYGGKLDLSRYILKTLEQFGSKQSENDEIRLALRQHGLGSVTAVSDSLNQSRDQDRQTQQIIEKVWQTALQGRTNWYVRHGFDANSASIEFNNWLIPGVGIAPVTEFQVLISFFVVGIGPVNYWLMRKWKRLPLFLLTVPVAAVLVTLLLFAYGILADGIGTRARARSFTLLDQRSGEAVCWARTSYYAGMAPAEGMQFPADTAVYPVFPAWAQNRQLSGRYQSQRRELQWTETQQQLSHGWLPSRTPTQYLTLAARPTARQIVIKNTGAGLRIDNRLETSVEALAVQDHENNFYWTEQLLPGMSATLDPVPFSEVAMKLRKIFSENEPEYPAGALIQRTTYLGPRLSQSVMEARLSAIIDPTNRSLGTGTYVAVTATGPEYHTGITSAEEVSSFHVVQGRW